MNIAWKNIMARKWSSTKVAISILMMLIIMCIFTAYSIALGEEKENVVNSYRSGHNFIVSTQTRISNEKVQSMKKLKGISNVVEIASYRNLSNLRGMTFNVGEKKYQCKHFYYEDDLFVGTDYYVNMLHFGNFAFVNSGEHLALSHHYEELRFRFNNNSPLLAGKDMVQDNEIIVSEYFLKEFGLDTSILGQKISITIGDKTYNNIVVAGILNKYYHQLTNSFTEHFIASFNSELYENLRSSCEYSTKLYVKDYMLSKDLMNEIKTLGYFKISAGSEYGLSMATTVTIIGNILAGVMATVGVGIISALILNIIYSMRFMITKKANFYGIMQAYGLKKKGLFNVLFCEMFILSLFAIIFAYAISYGLVYLLDFLMSNLVGIGVFFGWANFLITFVVAVCFTLAVVACVSLINYSLYYKKSTTKVLRNVIEN